TPPDPDLAFGLAEGDHFRVMSNRPVRPVLSITGRPTSDVRVSASFAMPRPPATISPPADPALVLVDIGPPRGPTDDDRSFDPPSVTVSKKTDKALVSRWTFS